ncbi:MAG: glycosyltransferase family 4 protein [Cytophagales bacterium]|nr:glycosyltransferase family 4 protein [Armatimonadota bacterium]
MAERTASPRIVVFLDHTAKWSGGEIALLRTLTALDPARVTPVVVLAEAGTLADRLHEARIETHILPLSGGAREVRKDTLGGGALVRHAGAGVAFLRYAVAVAQFAKKRGAFALHCNSLKSDLYGALAGRLAGIPVIWHVRDHIDPSYLPAPAVRALRSLARSAPTFVVAISDSVLEKLFPDPADRARQLASRARVIHDGLSDQELTTPLPAPTDRWKNDPPRVGMIGRFVAWKGQHIFLEAAQKLQNRQKAGNNGETGQTGDTVPGQEHDAAREAVFVLVGKPMFGEAEYEAELRRIAAPLGEGVEFLGFQSDIPAVLHDLDIFVHSSTTPEPFGQVVIEAMAEGVPVIASDGGGVREIIEQDVSGLRTPMGDADALAEALRGLLNDPARASRLARAGHTRVRADFTAARNARGIEAVYDDLAAASRRFSRRSPSRDEAEPRTSSGTTTAPPPNTVH